MDDVLVTCATINRNSATLRPVFSALGQRVGGDAQGVHLLGATSTKRRSRRGGEPRAALHGLPPLHGAHYHVSSLAHHTRAMRTSYGHHTRRSQTQTCDSALLDPPVTDTARARSQATPGGHDCQRHRQHAAAAGQKGGMCRSRPVLPRARIPNTCADRSITAHAQPAGLGARDQRCHCRAQVSPLPHASPRTAARPCASHSEAHSHLARFKQRPNRSKRSQLWGVCNMLVQVTSIPGRACVLMARALKPHAQRALLCHGPRENARTAHVQRDRAQA